MLITNSLRRQKERKDLSVKFPKKLCPAIAGITQDFSFAYLKEAFVATMLAIANDRSENGIKGGGDDGGEDLDDYELWREIKKQVRALRNDMDSGVVVKYQREEPMDLMLQPPEPATAAPAGSSSTPPFRPASNRAARNLMNPRLTNIDRDFNHAPLMTDGHKFLDTRFDEISIARRV